MKVGPGPAHACTLADVALRGRGACRHSDDPAWPGALCSPRKSICTYLACRTHIYIISIILRDLCHLLQIYLRTQTLQSSCKNTRLARVRASADNQTQPLLHRACIDHAVPSNAAFVQGSSLGLHPCPVCGRVCKQGHKQRCQHTQWTPFLSLRTEAVWIMPQAYQQ